MADFPSSNDTRATATNLGFISVYNVGSNVNAIRNESVNTPPVDSDDKFDYFVFRHTQGLSKVTIKLTLEDSPHASYVQTGRIELLDGFGVVVNGVIQGSDSTPPFPLQ